MKLGSFTVGSRVSYGLFTSGGVIDLGARLGATYYGRKPPVYLKPGDVFEIEIDAIGVLRNPVVVE